MMVMHIQSASQITFTVFGTYQGQVLSACMCFGQFVLLSQPCRKCSRFTESFTCSATSKVTKCDRQEAVSIVSLSCLSNIAE